jgi:hypothetical protein
LARVSTNARKRWQHLVDGHDFLCGYRSVKRFVLKAFGGLPKFD